jgi:DNA-binding IclR family transcriptional regulator
MSPPTDPEQVAPSSGSRIAVIDKAARVLDALLEVPAGLTPAEVAVAIGSNRSTAFRLLTSLEQAGLLDRDSLTARYRLGVKFLQYGEGVRAGMGLVDVADPTLRRLSDLTRLSVTLAIREGFGARCIHRIPGPDVESFAWKVGEWLPMHLGAAPKALLSGLPDAELESFLGQDGERRTRDGLLTGQDIREEVARTRRRGWSLNREGLTAGVTSLGSVIPTVAGTPVCAISVAGLNHHFRGDRLKQIAAAVTAAAAELGAGRAGDREVLQRWTRASTVPAAAAKRARTALPAANGAAKRGSLS